MKKENNKNSKKQNKKKLDLEDDKTSTLQCGSPWLNGVTESDWVGPVEDLAHLTGPHNFNFS